MITNLQIRNYRHNERLNVDLARITVFRGPSGSGKSSLLGALKWVGFNQPPGTKFIHWDHKFAAVRMRAEKRVIVRKRGKEENSYHVDGQKYVAFGSTVPSKVSSILNISPLNFQRQHAGPFWFRDTAGAVSRQLNAIVNLELIDTTLSNIDKEQRNTEAQIKYIKSQIEQAKEEKRRFRWVVSFDKKLRMLEREAEDHKEHTKRTQLLADLFAESKRLQKIAAQTIPDIKPLLKLHKQWKADRRDYEQLTELLGLAEQYEETITHTDNVIKRNEKKLKQLLGDRCPLCGNQIRKKS
jgi:AAA15 family ATPase/GTPase